MSRGFGRLQRRLWIKIVRHGKPMTFAELRAEYLGDEPDMMPIPSFERALRRSLRRMVSDGKLIAIGRGGSADPFRYFPDPVIIVMGSETEQATAWLDALAADPGANEALKKCLAKDHAAAQANTD